MTDRIAFNRLKVLRIIEILGREYPETGTALHYSNPFQLLIATVLSAQCTDERVNMVTKNLFKKYPTPSCFADADLNEIEEDIRPTGFFKNKAKAIKGLSTELIGRFSGNVPSDLDSLVSLPGVGRKTANVVLGEAFGIPGIVVDTHVKRLSNLIGLTQKQEPDKIELDLMEIVPKDQWTHFSNLLIYHGRAVCVARKPRHNICSIVDLCDTGVQWKGSQTE